MLMVVFCVLRSVFNALEERWSKLAIHFEARILVEVSCLNETLRPTPAFNFPLP
jgi:hypothetical protein